MLLFTLMFQKNADRYGIEKHREVIRINQIWLETITGLDTEVVMWAGNIDMKVITSYEGN